MRRLLLPLAAVAAVAVPVAGASAAKPKLHVFFPGDCQTNAYKPKTIVLACADANAMVNRIHWTSYGAKSANGRGIARVNDCTPNCAAGTFHRYPAKVRLSKVRQCGDVPQFTRLRVRFTGHHPKGMKKTETQRYPCANAPGR